jgi:hypothetical protein
VTATVTYSNPFVPSLVTKARDVEALVVGGVLLRSLFLRGEAPTSSSYAQPVPEISTQAAPPMVLEPAAPTKSTAKAVLELRRLSGLTWEELAGVFSVSRRAVHHWASGNTMSAEHIQHLFIALQLVRRLTSGSSAEVRAKLLAPSATGETGIDLLRAIDSDNADRTLSALALPATPTAAFHPTESKEPALNVALSTLEDRPVRSVRKSRIVKPISRGHG